MLELELELLFVCVMDVNVKRPVRPVGNGLTEERTGGGMSADQAIITLHIRIVPCCCAAARLARGCG